MSQVDDPKNSCVMLNTIYSLACLFVEAFIEGFYDS